jgi:CheY-like chemotaxis protein
MRPKKTILCVDDNEQAVSVRKFMLETRGYRVLTALTGAEALELVSQGSVDLVVSDLIMPQMDGNELVRRIKEMNPDLPTLLISGTVKAFERASNADAFMPKGSCSPLELLERIRLMIARKRGPKKHARTQLNPIEAAQPEHSNHVAVDRIPAYPGNHVSSRAAGLTGLSGLTMAKMDEDALDHLRASHGVAVAVASCRGTSERGAVVAPGHARRF